MNFKISISICNNGKNIVCSENANKKCKIKPLKLEVLHPQNALKLAYKDSNCDAVIFSKNLNFIEIKKSYIKNQIKKQICNTLKLFDEQYSILKKHRYKKINAIYVRDAMGKKSEYFKDTIDLAPASKINTEADPKPKITCNYHDTEMYLYKTDCNNLVSFIEKINT